MKQVFLIGDSIRFGSGDNSPGYGRYVKQALEGKAVLDTIEKAL